MSGNVTYNELYQKALDMISSRFEANQLFTHVTQKRVHHLPQVGHQLAPEKQRKLLVNMCEQRHAGVPLQYLLGEWEFYGLPFKVGRGVLIPRADTETIVDISLEMVKDSEKTEILDLCSGTGCVAVALSHNLPHASVTALEMSDYAYDYLLRNIALNNCPVKPVRQDLHTYHHPVPLDLITCNPPYIPSETLSTLQGEVWYEPRAALSGGPDGLTFYHSISRLYRNQLKPDGWICFEVGKGQSEKVKKILAENSYTDIMEREDLNRIPRVVYARRG